VDTTRFPDFLNWTTYAHAQNPPLTVGWVSYWLLSILVSGPHNRSAPAQYGNNCACADNCSETKCFMGDVLAHLNYGFDSTKLDGCGREKNINLFSDLFNLTGKAYMIENCHNGERKR
jgi:hypothetical protein